MTLAIDELKSIELGLLENNLVIEMTSYGMKKYCSILLESLKRDLEHQLQKCFI